MEKIQTHYLCDLLQHLTDTQSANTVKANICFITSPYTNIIKYLDIDSLVIYC